MQSSPFDDCDQSDTDGSSEDEATKYYCVRFTPHDKFISQDVINWLTDNSDIVQYVLATETTPKLHYHLVIGSEEDPKDIRQNCQSFIRQYWLQPGTNKCPKGFGSSQWNFQACKDLKAAIAYCSKYKDYIFEGFDPEFIEECSHLSYIAPKNRDFKQDYRALMLLFHETDMTKEEFATQYMFLQSKYERIVNPAHAVGYALSALARRNPEEFRTYTLQRLKSLF